MPCGRRSRLSLSFLLHVKYTVTYRIVSYPTKSVENDAYVRSRNLTSASYDRDLWPLIPTVDPFLLCGPLANLQQNRFIRFKTIVFTEWTMERTDGRTNGGREQYASGQPGLAEVHVAYKNIDEDLYSVNGLAYFDFEDTLQGTAGLPPSEATHEIH